MPAEDQEKRAARLARFGPVGGSGEGGEGEQKKKKAGPLEFTLDEYKSKKKHPFPGRNKKFNAKFKNK